MKSLRLRLTLGYALLVSLSVGVVLYAARLYLDHNLITSIDLLNAVEFQEIEARLDKAHDETDSRTAMIQAVRDHAELDAALYFFQVSDTRTGEILYHSSNLGPYTLPAKVFEEPKITVFDDELGYLRSGEFQFEDLTVHIASSLNSAESLLDSYERVSLAVCFVAFLVSLGLGYSLTRLALRPIAAVQATAQRITASNFRERIPVPDSKDEVAQMAGFLNEMLDRLEASYEQVRRFTAEASHEFRTPLSFIRLQAERLIANEHLSPKERQDALAEQMDEIERLNKLIDDLLFLAKSDAGAFPLTPKRVPLDEFLSDFAADARLLAEDRGVQFLLRGNCTGDWQFDPAWMRQVLLNLFSNALKVSPTGGLIELHANQANDRLTLAMCDQGPGLPDDMLSRIFERFETGSPANGERGNGLGLAICRSIVQRHRGTIIAENRTSEKGLCVELSLPRSF